MNADHQYTYVISVQPHKNPRWMYCYNHYTGKETEVKTANHFDQCHTASSWQGQNPDTDLSDSKAHVFPTTSFLLLPVGTFIRLTIAPWPLAKIK